MVLNYIPSFIYASRYYSKLITTALRNMAGRSKVGSNKNISNQKFYKCTNTMSIDAFTENNLHNYVAQSDTHLNTKEMECWLGIDEAGRGPVLGRYEWMVVGGGHRQATTRGCK